MKKTSQTHPLQINAVQVPGTKGMIGMTLCPGKVQKSAISGDWERDLDTDLQAIQDWGAASLVTLMEPHELVAFKVPDLPRRIPEGLTHWTLPIPDGGVPDAAWEKQWAIAGAKLRGRLKEGQRIVIHCRGGLGRTGTVAARLLVEFGMAPEQAINAVRKARPGAIENQAQEAHVRKQIPLAQALRRPYHRIPPEQASRFRGCLLGGAVGDALGAPVEFKDLKTIRATFGPTGIRDFVPAYGRLGAITDDTQMTLFTAEGIIRHHVRGKLRGLTTVEGVVGHAYLRWLLTQGHPSPVKEVGRDGWLWTCSELFSARAPGNTCISALKAFKALGDGSRTQNSSKGCGGVMRVAPIGLYAASRRLPSQKAFTWGCEVAALTHGHPSGQLPAGVLAMLVCDLAQGLDLPEAVGLARRELLRHPDHEETLAAMDLALRLASSQISVDEALAQLGQGWVAEEALAISLYCALTAPNLEEGIIRAVNLTGDSDSTGAITGNILGAWLGVHEIPARWLAPLELRDTLTEIADDLATIQKWALSEFGHDTPEAEAEQDYWCERYPGW